MAEASLAGRGKVVVVESPAKAMTIRQWLDRSYRVIATRGHVRGLPLSTGSVDPENGFAMKWESSRGATRTLKAIARALTKAGTLVLATDPGREGEAIAWQVLDWLQEQDRIGSRSVKRIVLHEMTEEAVHAALGRPRCIDMKLVSAWQARHALDCLVEYKLTPLLWRKLPCCRSAGGLQSVALRLVTDRESEIETFLPRSNWAVDVELETKGGISFTASLARIDGRSVEDSGLCSVSGMRRAVRRIAEAQFRAGLVSRDTLLRPPDPSLTTASLLSEASDLFGFDVGQTMAIARHLYDGVDLGASATGLITNPRTGSTTMSACAAREARVVVRGRYGREFNPSQPRLNCSPVQVAREGEETIRPTRFGRMPEHVARYLDADSSRLYELIWRRALASQMASARVERMRVELEGEGSALVVAAECSIISFEGHFRVLAKHGCGPSRARDGCQESLLPIRTGEPVAVRAVRHRQMVSEAPRRLTVSSLVGMLEERGIGRSHNWAALLVALQEHGHAKLQGREFFPTVQGRLVTAFLEYGFAQWMDCDLAAEMENDLDRIVAGALEMNAMMDRLWGRFEASLNELNRIERATVRAAIEDRLDIFLFGSEREHPERRNCPACGKDMLELKLSRFGPFVGCSSFPDCGYRQSFNAFAAESKGHVFPRMLGSDPGNGMAVTLRVGPASWYVQRGERAGKLKPDRMSLPPSLDPARVDLELALRLLALPRTVGRHPETGEPVLASIGRYGPWVHHAGSYAPVPRGVDVLELDMNGALELIAEKEIRLSRASGSNTLLRELGRHPGDGAKVRLKTGRFGPFIAHRRRYVSLPKDIEPEALTMELALDILGYRLPGDGIGWNSSPDGGHHEE